MILTCLFSLQGFLMNTAPLSLWAPYGLTESPFFQEELKPNETARHPISLFVGRAPELTRLSRRLVSDPLSRSIVQGPPGIGKTSFVNRLKVAVAEHGIASHENPIRITSDMTHAAFVRESLRTLLRIRMGIRDVDPDADFWKRTVLLLEGLEVTGGGINLGGFGATVSRSIAPPQLPIDSLFEHLGEALSRIRAEAGQGVLIHVNNLDNQALEHPEELSILIRDLRDYFLLDGAHWVFVGTAGIESAIFRKHDQVSGIFPHAESLEPLTPTEVSQLLEERYQHLELPRRRHTPPVEAETAARLYAFYGGDLRNFLRLLGEAAERLLGLDEIRPMRFDEIARAMQGEYLARIKPTLSENDTEHLRKIVCHDPGAFRVSDAAKITGLSPGGASKLVDRLLGQRVIRHERTDGRNTYYLPTGQVLIAFGAVRAS